MELHPLRRKPDGHPLHLHASMTKGQKRAAETVTYLCLAMIVVLGALRAFDIDPKALQHAADKAGECVDGQGRWGHFYACPWDPEPTLYHDP